MASSPESVATEVIKYGPEKLITMLTVVFNQYVNAGSVPAAWKTAWITPMYKKGRKDLCDNCRGKLVTSIE
jgi:hypothetical protein